jgi:hypothetical protein
LRFLGRSGQRKAAGYAVRPPYAQARAELLARRPPAGHSAAGPFGRLFEVVVDLASEDSVVSVFLLADGSISVFSTQGIHSTGLRGAPKVVAASEVIVEEIRSSPREFTAVDDLATLPLPDHGETQILIRTVDGDMAASHRLGSRHALVAQVAAMALILTGLARQALVEGFDRVEAGEVSYNLSPEYRRIREALLDWLPPRDQIPASARVASVAVEIGETQTVTTLFAFADGSTSLYRSDGTLVEGLSSVAGVTTAARALLESIEGALAAFGPVQLVPLPQPGRVQFVVRARLGEEAEWTELVAVAGLSALEDRSSPLSAAFDRANEVLRIAE